LKGINNLSTESHSKIVELRNNVFKMNLSLMGDLLERFIIILGQLSQEIHNEKLKSEASITALKIISTARMFETIMNIEIIKRNLRPRVDS